MKINGITMDTRHLAEGLYQIICQQGMQGVVAVGMMPKDIVDLVDQLLREKVKALAAANPSTVNLDRFEYTVEELTRAIHSEIYAVASDAGKLLV
jgi:hypothetical protein